MHGDEAEADAEEEAAPWQEQYDQGMEYFSEENYEEAITAFTDAIEIDPEQALLYVSRGNAYVLRAAEDEDEVEEDLDELRVKVPAFFEGSLPPDTEESFLASLALSGSI